MASLAEVVQYADDYLRVREIEDWANALNGLQIQNSGRVTKIGAAVDASTRVLNEAAKKDVDLLLVHHGLFWPGLQTVTGALHRQLKLAMEKDIALYSAHLPLDIHPEVGNNAQLAAALGLKSTRPFFEEKGQLIGVESECFHFARRNGSQISGVVRRGTAHVSLWAGANIDNRHYHRWRRLGDLQSGAGKDRHVHHRRSAALGRGRGRRTRNQSFARRPLRDGNFWRESIGRASLEKVSTAV